MGMMAPARENYRDSRDTRARKNGHPSTVPEPLKTRSKPLGFFPLPGIVGYGATIWNLPPTHPPRITEQSAPGEPDPPPRIAEHGAGNQWNYSGDQVNNGIHVN
jgi:hypothetical protein